MDTPNIPPIAQNPPPLPPPIVEPAPLSPKSKAWLWIVLIVIVAAAGIGGWWIFYKPAAKPTQNIYELAANAREIASGDLMLDYMDNPDRADSMYRDKLLRVQGLVANTDEDVMGRIFVALATGDVNKPVVCIVLKTDPLASKLKKGNAVIIAGTCDGLTQNVRIKDAVILSAN